MKKIRILFTLIALISFHKSFAQLDLLDEAYAFYPLGGDCMDYSGNNFHLTCTNADTADGYYLNAQGSTVFNGVNTKIIRPALVLDDTMTIAGWYYSTSNLQNCNLFYNGNSGFNGYGVFLKKPMTTFGLGNKIVVVQGGLSENIVDTTFSMPLNEWAHIALVIRGTYFELYVNGVLRGSGTRPFNPPAGEFSIGMSSEQQAGGFPSFFGRVDDVSIYKRNCTASWIYRLYTEGFVTRNKALSAQTSFSVSSSKESNVLSINSSEPVSEVELFDFSGRQIPVRRISEAVNSNGVETKIETLNAFKGFGLVRIAGKSGLQSRKVYLD